MEIKHKFIHHKSYKFTYLIQVLLMSSYTKYLSCQLELSCSNSTKETLYKKVSNMFKVNNKDTRRATTDIFVVSLILTLNIFHVLY